MKSHLSCERAIGYEKQHNLSSPPSPKGQQRGMHSYKLARRHANSHPLLISSHAKFLIHSPNKSNYEKSAKSDLNRRLTRTSQTDQTNTASLRRCFEEAIALTPYIASWSSRNKEDR